MFIILGADGKEYGPVTAAHVHEWILDGRANLQTKVRLDQETAWKTLGDFPEFNRQAAPASSARIPSAPPLLAARGESDRPAMADASRWLRLPAAMVDGFLKILCFLPITIPLARFAQADALRSEPRPLLELLQIINRIVEENRAHTFPFLGTLVLVQLGLLAWRGQSVGKLLLGIRIVRAADDGRPGVGRAFFLRGALPTLIEQVPLLGLLFWAVDSCFIFREDRRCLHDLIAGTKVVKH